MSNQGWPKVSTQNKYQGLQEDDEEEDDEEDLIEVEPADVLAGLGIADVLAGLGRADVLAGRGRADGPPPGLPKKGFERIQRKKWKKIKFGHVC